MIDPSSDFILRMVQQFVAALARLLFQKELPQAHDLLQQTAQRLLGFELEVLLKIPVAQQALLLTAPERIEAAAELIAGLALVETAQGTTARVEALRANARALLDEAIARGHLEPKRLRARQSEI